MEIQLRRAQANRGEQVASAIPAGNPNGQADYILCDDAPVTETPSADRLFCFELQRASEQPQAALELARTYGTLRAPEPVLVADHNGAWLQRLGEPLARWRELAETLRQATNLWRMSLASNWRDWDAFFERNVGNQEPRPGSPGELEQMVAGCYALLDEQIQHALHRSVGVGLPPFADRTGPSLIAGDLYDYAWLELAGAVAADAVPVRCTVCDGWYPTHGGIGRSDKKYCSDACRMRAYRARKKRAKRVH